MHCPCFLKSMTCQAAGVKCQLLHRTRTAAVSSFAARSETAGPAPANAPTAAAGPLRSDTHVAGRRLRGTVACVWRRLRAMLR